MSLLSGGTEGKGPSTRIKKKKKKYFLVAWLLFGYYYLHAIHVTLWTYLSCNRKFILFDCLHPFHPPTLASGIHHLYIYEFNFVLFCLGVFLGFFFTVMLLCELSCSVMSDSLRP